MQTQTPDRFSGIHHISTMPFIMRDCVELLCGMKLGSGQFRDVYQCNIIRNAVVKVSTEPQANWCEYNVWQSVADQKYAKWFAPVLWISPGGHLLIMQKARMLKYEDKKPAKIPSFFTDLKLSNFGWIGKQLVCTDYQFITRAIDIAFGANFRKFELIES